MSLLVLGQDSPRILSLPPQPAVTQQAEAAEADQGDRRRLGHGLHGELTDPRKIHNGASRSGGRSRKHAPDRGVPRNRIASDWFAAHAEGSKFEQQIPGTRIIAERRGKRRHDVKLPGVARTRQIGGGPGARPAKDERVVRADVVGEGAAQPGDRPGRRRGENLVVHR
jgi:hypothetical protein